MLQMPTPRHLIPLVLLAFSPGVDAQHLEAELFPTPGAQADRFASRIVDVHGDVAVMMAPGDDTLAPDAGAIYVFRRVQGD